MAPLKSEGKQTFEVEIRVNTAAKPKEIDTKNLDGPENGFGPGSTYLPRRRRRTSIGSIPAADIVRSYVSFLLS